MPQYKTPDFCSPPAGLATVFENQSKRSFFDLPLWYDLMARFGVPSGTEICVFTDERPGSRVAVPLRLVANNRRLGLKSLANFYSVEHDLIAAPDADLKIGFGAVLSEIKRSIPRCDCLSFSELDPASPSYGILYQALRDSGFLVECVFASGTWYEDTTGMSFGDFIAARPSELRNTWRRKQRSLERSGRLRVAFFPGDIEIEEAITDYQTTYGASWKEAEPFPQFMPALIKLAAELGALRLGIYYVDGLPAAAQFWILWKDRAVIYKLAHDKQLDELSLGTLLTMEMVERVLAGDCPREINFGRGDDPYKKLWLPKRRERWHLNAYNPRTVGGLASGLRQEAAKFYHRLRGEPTMPPSFMAQRSHAYSA